MVAPPAETVFGQLQHLFGQVLYSPLPEGRFQRCPGHLHKKDISARNTQKRSSFDFLLVLGRHYNKILMVPQHDLHTL